MCERDTQNKDRDVERQEQGHREVEQRQKRGTEMQTDRGRGLKLRPVRWLTCQVAGWLDVYLAE